METKHAADLYEVAKAYEAWEGDLIMSEAAWAPHGTAEYPRLTKALWDRLLEIQDMRNAAIAKAEGR